jgi:crotonobetainyl-CoA:carnitine CoA-transferase CaiB-like acyl-CoA transferase
MAGPLEGLRVVEISHEACAWAGKLLADLGADTIVVEPPGGSAQRRYGPWLDDEPGADRSLWWWHYNTSKRSVVLDLDDAIDRARFVDLVGDADILLDGEAPGRLAALGIDHADLAEGNPGLIHASVTPYGRTAPSRDLPATDLTVLAGGGPVWSCGYDDHSLPPVRGGGNQGFHIASHWAVQAVLVALFDRDQTGEGQFIDVSMHAAANVTTESATYGYLAAGVEVQRQTGRHAWWEPTSPTQIECADGRYMNTGTLPRTPREFASILAWLDELGLRDEFPLSAILELGAGLETIDLSRIDRDPMLAEILGAAREVGVFLSQRLGAYDEFIGWQSQGMAAGVIYSPDEAIADPHVVARGFPTEVEHPEHGRTFTYPGPLYRFGATPAGIRHRAPRLGEHQAEVGPAGEGG